jgi:hypothetical protein
MRRLAFCLRILAGIIVLVSLGGCGDQRNRQEITGEVKLKGQPIEQGIIHFHPQDGQETGDGAAILKGKYQIPRQKGLSPGKYRVTIYAGNGVSGEGEASPDSPNAGKRLPRERVPPEYNEKSKLIAEVKPGGQNKFDYDIP